MSHLDPLTRLLLANGPYRRTDAPKRVVKMGGADAEEFLHRLCTQDVRALAAGRCAPVAFLDNKGKVQVTGQVGRGGDALWLETDAEQVERLLALLDRYHFTEKLSFAVLPGSCTEWVGAEWPAGSTVNDQSLVVGPEGVLFCVQRRGVRWLRAHGVPLPASCTGGPLPDEIAEALRMAAGFVRVGIDTEPTTLALEADLDDHCSTTKGCYTGQEIVARIHTYGHVNRRLCLLHLADGPAIGSPMPLLEPQDQIPVGRVMHAVRLAAHGRRIGLGYLPADFQALGTRLQLAAGDAVEVVGFARD